VQVADAHLVVAKERENPQPRPVGQRLEGIFQPIDGGSSRLHISALTDIAGHHTFVNANV
jgi:hypothetical protein